jgi:hypothetical protein
MPSHQILLLNFTERERTEVAQAGYNVERGIMEQPTPRFDQCPFESPHPIYEYDILFYNSARKPELNPINPQNLVAERGSLRALRSFNTLPRVRIAFIGEDVGLTSLTLGGIEFATLIDAERNVSSLRKLGPGPFSIDQVHRLIAGLSRNIASVGQFYSVPANNYPYNHSHVLVSKSHQGVAGYGTTYDEPRTGQPR